MKNTISIKENRDFRRLYGRGRSSASDFVAVYFAKNRLDFNRLGLTVGVKIGGAVTRNHIKRLIREAYRLHEAEFLSGIDLVVVARRRAASATFHDVEKSLMQCAYKLKVAKKLENMAEKS